MNVKIELDEREVMQAIANYVAAKSGVSIETKSLNVEVKSKQNYKSEWETAAIRVKCEVYSKVTV